MATVTVCPNSKHIELPCLNMVEWRQPFTWLHSGWEDFKSTWTHSLALGSVFALLGYGLTHIAWSHWHIALSLTTGFLLVSPFLAIGFYELSRRREGDLGKTVSPRENLASIGLFAALLMFIFSAWERISAIVLGIYLGPRPVPEASLSWLFSAENWPFLLAFIAVGAVLAAFSFALSVISVPMLMDRRVDLVTAIMSSLYVVRLNPRAMLVWAATIVVATAIGIATNFIGLAVIFPLLGHATWHAYRELVER
jgi:uncharacterized membrane protein